MKTKAQITLILMNASDFHKAHSSKKHKCNKKLTIKNSGVHSTRSNLNNNSFENTSSNFAYLL